jgi:hypothetical protein
MKKLRDIVEFAPSEGGDAVSKQHFIKHAKAYVKYMNRAAENGDNKHYDKAADHQHEWLKHLHHEDVEEYVEHDLYDHENDMGKMYDKLKQGNYRTGTTKTRNIN